MDLIAVLFDLRSKVRKVFLYDLVDFAGHEIGCLGPGKIQKIGYYAVETIGLLNNDV